MRQSAPEDRLHLLRLAQEIARARPVAREELQMRSATPPDAPTRCRCDSQEHHRLPPEIDVLRLAMD